MSKMHYHYLHGALCRTQVTESGLTMFSSFVTCRNCLWLMKSVAERIEAGETAVGRTYSRQVNIVRKAIWDMSATPSTGRGGWPSIYDIADFTGITPARVLDICDTEQGIMVDKIGDRKGILYDRTRARVVQN